MVVSVVADLMAVLHHGLDDLRVLFHFPPQHEKSRLGVILLEQGQNLPGIDG